MTIEIIKPEWPAPERVAALATTRLGGVSEGPWASLNLGGACGDTAESVAHNRRLLDALLPAKPQWLNQVHGRTVVQFGETASQAGADAITATHPGQVCAVLTADCLPVLFCDQSASWVAAAHAGWRGLAAGVLEATVASYPGKPGELMTWLGPAIGPDVYEVGSEVRQAFVQQNAESSPAFIPRGDRWLMNIYSLARMRLLGSGVEAVYGGGFCTHSDARRFFSYRRDGKTGRMASLIWLRD